MIDMIEDTNNMQPKEDTNWRTFFERNPNKVLGETISIKTRFGEQNFRVKGNIEELSKIDLPNYKTTNGSDFSLTEINRIPTIENISQNEMLTLFENNKKSKEQIVDTIIRVKDSDLWSFNQVDEKYNKGITVDEKTAYVYYLEKILGSKVKGGFSKFSIEQNISNEKELMRKRVLCYDITEVEEKRRFKPSFFFVSGNLYDKKRRIIAEKDFYIKKFGEEITNIHLDILEQGYQDVWSKRLTLDNPDISNRLKLNVSSDFCKKHKLKKITLGSKVITDIEVYVASIKGKNVINIGKEVLSNTRDDNKQLISEYSITDGFVLWLKKAGNNANAMKYGIMYRNDMNYKKIYNYYISGSQRPKDVDKKDWLRIKGYATTNGEKLFAQFLENGITTEDRRLIENLWNSQFNGDKEYQVSRVPIGFSFNGLLDIRDEKRKAISFNMLRGSSCLAYGVGMGKTWCAIFTIAQNLELGFCKRPLIVVPNQVYPQFAKEIGLILPQYKLNKLYNARNQFEKLANNIEDNTISIITYEGLESLSFSENLDNEMLGNMTQIISQGNDNLTERQKAKQKEKFDEILGKAKYGSTIEFDSPNVDFDYIAVDEAHNFKKVFTQVKGEVKTEQGETDKISYEKTQYQISSGNQSTMAIKLFYLTQYIQKKNVNGNCLLLTATPFTNSPLEVYSILSLINYKYLKDIGLGNLKEFFDHYAQMTTELVMSTALEPVRRQVFSGFNNLVSLQSLIFKFIDKPTIEEEEKNVTRPNKIILPLNSKTINGIAFKMTEQNKVSTTIELTQTQVDLWEDLKLYASGDLDQDDLMNDETSNLTTCSKLYVPKTLSKNENDVEVEETNVSEEARDKELGAGVRALQCLTYGRQLALSPYLYRYSGIKIEPTYLEYVEQSPKLSYVVECIKTVKKHHENDNTPMSGQVIYMDIGTECFHYIVEYLIKELNFNENEVGYITGSKSVIGTKKTDKDKVQDAFLGREWNMNTEHFDKIPHENRLKILIGSSAIKEGINLQTYASVLYNLYIDFNPTDMTQLEGRIWRQGNSFNNVRIVIPLMENSMDIFMFQKLQEKTKRINQIWTRNGVNELNLTDFNPEELKYELITKPETLAKFTLDSDKLKIDEEIEDVNIKATSLRKAEGIYEDIDSFYKDTNSRDVIKFSRMGNIYRIIRMIRPSFLTKTFINYENENELTEDQKDKGFFISPNRLNYTPSELFKLYVQVKKEGKLEYPIGYSDNFRDRIVTDTPDLNNYEPIIIGTKKFKDEISNINEFQKYVEYNRFNYEISKSILNFNARKNLSLDNPLLLDLSPYDEFLRLYDVLNISYMIPNEKTEYIDKLKPTTFFERIQNQYFDSNLGYKTKLPSWSNEYPLFTKRIERAEEELLRPLSINNQEELAINIKELEEKVISLIEKQKNINSDEYLKEKVEIIKVEMARIKSQGIRKASTYTQRSYEFATPNEDYEGNLLLNSLVEIKPKKIKDKETNVKPKLTKETILDRILALGIVLEMEEDKTKKENLIDRINGLKMLAE